MVDNRKLQRMKTYTGFKAIYTATTVIVVLTHFLLGILIGILYFPTKTLYLFLRKITVNYEMNEVEKEKYRTLIKNVESLNKSQMIWFVEGRRINNDPRRHSGADLFISQEKASITKGSPFIKANLETITIEGRNKLINFLPDGIIFKNEKGITFVPYENIRITANKTQMIEEMNRPTDSKIVDYTWKYINKDGTPDKRFNGNYKIPVYIYGKIGICISGYEDIEIHVSNEKLAMNFVE